MPSTFATEVHFFNVNQASLMTDTQGGIYWLWRPPTGSGIWAVTAPSRRQDLRTRSSTLPWCTTRPTTRTASTTAPDLDDGENNKGWRVYHKLHSETAGWTVLGLPRGDGNTNGAYVYDNWNHANGADGGLANPFESE